MRSVVIAVAITGSVPRKRDNPAVPVTGATLEVRRLTERSVEREPHADFEQADI